MLPCAISEFRFTSLMKGLMQVRDNSLLDLIWAFENKKADEVEQDGGEI